MTAPIYPAPHRIGGGYAMKMEIWRADRYGQKLDRISTRRPVTGSVSFNEDNEFKRQLSLSIDDPDDVRPFRDFVVPTIHLAGPFGATRTRDLGHFMVTPPSRSMTSGRRTGRIEARDLTLILARSQVGGFTRPAGTDLGLIAYDLAIAAGLLPAQLDIPVTTGTVSVDPYVPAPGIRTLVEMNRLLNAANCHTVWTTGAGVVISRAYQDAARATPVRTYSNAEGFAGLPILSPLVDTPNWEGLRNVVTVRNLQPGKPPIWWTERITDRNHPLFYDPDDPDAGFGYELAGDPIDNSQLPDEAAARALAKSLLAQAASRYRKLAIRTIVDIDAEGHDILGLDIRDGQQVVYDGNWRRRTWAIAVAGVSATMESETYRTDQYNVAPEAA